MGVDGVVFVSDYGMTDVKVENGGKRKGKKCRKRRKGKINMSRYVLWDAHFPTGRPNKLAVPSEGVLSGAALQNLSCHSIVDLRDPKTVDALNLTRCRACFDALTRAKNEAIAAAKASAQMKAARTTTTTTHTRAARER